jgi:HNH endonuclease
MRQIPLSQGQVALVDDEDYPLLSEFNWCYRPERNGKQGYAVRHRKVDGKDRLCYLHREVLPAPQGLETIFLNHDRLDCRRSNLKVVTKQEARQHHRVRRDSKSQAKGVRYNPDCDNWSAVVYRGGRCWTVGTFDSEASAIREYESALIRENPDLHRAPARVERPRDPPPTQEGNPDAACANQDPAGPVKINRRQRNTSDAELLLRMATRRALPNGTSDEGVAN